MESRFTGYQQHRTTLSFCFHFLSLVRFLPIFSFLPILLSHTPPAIELLPLFPTIFSITFFRYSSQFLRLHSFCLTIYHSLAVLSIPSLSRDACDSDSNVSWTTQTKGNYARCFRDPFKILHTNSRKVPKNAACSLPANAPLKPFKKSVFRHFTFLFSLSFLDKWFLLTYSTFLIAFIPTLLLCYSSLHFHLFSPFSSCFCIWAMNHESQDSRGPGFKSRDRLH